MFCCPKCDHDSNDHFLDGCHLCRCSLTAAQIGNKMMIGARSTVVSTKEVDLDYITNDVQAGHRLLLVEKV